MVQAYCVKCRAKTDIKDPKEVKLKNGRPAVKGTCPTLWNKCIPYWRNAKRIENISLLDSTFSKTI